MKKNRISSQVLRLLTITMLGSGAFAMGERAEQESYQSEPDSAGRMDQGQYSQDQSGERDMSQTAKDAWIQGKLEATFAYHQDLSSFAIDTEVKNGTVHLEGNVESETAKELAEQLSMNIDGVNEVENNLSVVPDADSQG
jgi:osmotically-inducible protein OsmY